MRFALKKISLKQKEIALMVQKEIGFPVTFEKLKADWFGLSLGISIEKVVVMDSTVPVGFMAIDHVYLIPELSSFFLDNIPKFHKIVLQGFKMTIGLDKEKGLSILGLNGENIPTLIDYAQVMQLLSKQQSIYFEDSKLNWLTNENTIKQILEGELTWSEVSEKDWILEGRQQLQINNHQPLPETNFKINTVNKTNEIQVELGEKNDLANCKLQNVADKGWTINCHAEIHDLLIAESFKHYQPTVKDPVWLQWLASTALKGDITNTHIELQGLLNNPTWQATLNFKDVFIKYSPGWPDIHQGEGILKVNNQRAAISLKSGKILDANIHNANMMIDWSRDDINTTLSIIGLVEGTLESGLKFLQQSPLINNVATALEPLEPQGKMNLNLSLIIPFINNGKVKYDGTIETKMATIKLPNFHEKVSHLQGFFHFSEDKLQAKAIKARLFKQNLELDIESTFGHKQKAMEFSVAGTLNARLFQRALPFPWLSYIKGKSLFTLNLKFPGDYHAAPEWRVNSDLVGMTIELPGFLGKEAKNPRLMEFRMKEHQKENRISLHLMDTLDLKLIQPKSLKKGELAQYSGHLVFGKNKADWNTKESLLIGGEIPHLNVSIWRDFLKSQPISDATSFQKFNVHVLIDHLELSGLSLEKTWVTTNFIKRPDKWVMEGPFVNGSISENKNEWNLDLSLLNAVLSDNSTGKANLIDLEEKLINFNCQHFQINHKDYGGLSFKLVPENNRYLIQELNLDFKDTQLTGSGEWHNQKDKTYTTMQVNLSSSNMGQALSHLGYPSEIRDAKGNIHYQFEWFATPFDFNIEGVTGKAEIKLDKGRILGVDPGLGRVMGLLNIENIRRRLQLDFSDLLKKGFVFDTLRGDLRFEKGVAKTENLKIDGPSAKITLSGKAELKTKAIDIRMTVVPHMGLGLPLAAMIASGNPAVGAGVWIIDKITGSKIKKITEHHYHVTGTWNAPEIKDIDPINTNKTKVRQN